MLPGESRSAHCYSNTAILAQQHLQMTPLNEINEDYQQTLIYSSQTLPPIGF